MDAHEITRREFVKVGTAGAAALVIGGSTAMAEPPMPERALGRTGHRVRLFSLGGQATLEKPGTHDESIAIINRAIDLGVNYIDTAAAYGRSRTPGDTTPPISQTYIGEVMKTRRKEVFLATKTNRRTKDEALKQLDESLKLLRTDRIDLWQIHNVSTGAQLEQIFGPSGVIEALQQARDQKIVRFLGITGHADPRVLAKAIDRFPFDAILMAINPADRHRPDVAFIEKLLPLANQKQMGVIGMKIPARGRIFREGGITTIKDSLTYVLTQPVSTVIIGCDNVKQLEENIAIAAAFTPLTRAEQARIEGLTASYASEAAFFKTGGAGFGAPRGRDDQNMDY